MNDINYDSVHRLRAHANDAEKQLCVGERQAVWLRTMAIAMRDAAFEIERLRKRKEREFITLLGGGAALGPPGPRGQRSAGWRRLRRDGGRGGPELFPIWMTVFLFGGEGDMP